MPNFIPIRDYSFRIMDALIDAHGLEGPFLDAGCGLGNFAKHLAQRGWKGTAIDSSAEAVRAAEATLQGYPVQMQCGDLMELSGNYRTIISIAVLEHVQDDMELLRRFRQCFVAQGGWLILAVPTNPEQEWRWDDDFYGHYRRYTKENLRQLLAKCGFEMLEFCDYTFPIFWAMRRAYTRLLPRKKPRSTVPLENTAVSSLNNAWELGRLSNVVAALPVWGAVSAIQRLFRHGTHGFEAMIVARTIEQ